MNKILIVDDDKTFLEEMKTALTSTGYDVEAISEGAATVRVADNNRPDLILLDMKLDGISGFQVANDLKHFIGTRHIPVIALTGCFTETLHKTFMKNLGIRECFIKPINPDELISKINDVLRERASA
jgi:DNA-binding response OmpR family regulator